MSTRGDGVVLGIVDIRSPADAQEVPAACRQRLASLDETARRHGHITVSRLEHRPIARIDTSGRAGTQARALTPQQQQQQGC